jgi:hypothetical protein
MRIALTTEVRLVDVKHADGSVGIGLMKREQRGHDVLLLELTAEQWRELWKERERQ